MIYLDNCATTKPRQEVVDEVVKMLKNDFANPSSLHSFGLKAEKVREEARKNLAQLINVLPSEIYFTSGGTESNNIAVNGFVNKNKRFKKIITSKIEHASLYDKFLSYRDLGYEVVFLNVDFEGKVDFNELKREVDGNTALVALAHVNNEIGTIQDIKELVKIVKEKNPETFVHVDGVQALGKIKLDLKDLGVDSYSVSSHKIYGPKGSGALYLKSGISIPSLVIGGGQEKNLRSGTENMPGLAGFGKACQIETEKFNEEQDHVKKIKAYFLENLKNYIDDYKINSPLCSSPYIVSLSIRGTRGEVILHSLEEYEIYISTASACSSNGVHRSHVLEAIKLNPSEMEGTIRICFSKDISKNDIDVFLEKLGQVVKDIREVMKKWVKEL